MDFTGKVVIVTGASSGIGAASALLFAKHGAKLTLVGRDEARLTDIAERCKECKGIEPLSIRRDLMERGACEDVVSKTAEVFGRIDVLVNSAGYLMLASLFDDTLDVFDDMFDILLKVPCKLTHLCLPHLMKTKGNVVNLTVTNYNKVRHGFLPYSVAKCALEKFTKLAAFELASAGVRVNSVNPGVTRTNLLKNLAMSECEINTAYKGLATLCNMKILEPEEVAKMVVFVASGICPSINGAEMCIDGGAMML